MKLLKERINNSLIVLTFKLMLELLYEYWQLLPHLGSVNMWKTKWKVQSFITIETHAIEKGLSLSNPKPGFGIKRVSKLLDYLKRYLELFHDYDFIKIPLNVITEYVDFQAQQSVCMAEIVKKINYFNISPITGHGGIKSVKKNEASNYVNFKTFVESRYSLRYFSKLPVKENDIITAIEIAKKTPSACNRQAWHVHLFKSQEIKNKLLVYQRGNNGFTEYIDKVALVTSNLNSFFIHEIHQGYVDGGLFAMSFIYALHDLGIATIPLTTSFPSYYRSKLYKEFSIPKNEIPILMVGIGNYPDEVKVAVSQRKNTDSFYTIH